MTPKDLAAEAAWEYERLTADGRMHDHGLLTRIIQSAIEKATKDLQQDLYACLARRIVDEIVLALMPKPRP